MVATNAIRQNMITVKSVRSREGQHVPTGVVERNIGAVPAEVPRLGNPRREGHHGGMHPAAGRRVAFGHAPLVAGAWQLAKENSR